MKNLKFDTKILDNLIYGRIEPHIYAFSTETVPNYLKVGDTYRPIEARLNEWRKYFPNLEKQFTEIAKVDEETFYRDFAVHYFLENELKKERLDKKTIKNLPYFSNEFFKNATNKDIKDAIKDIKNNHDKNNHKYQYYKFDASRIPITHTYARTENYNPRPNQKETIDKFNNAIEKGRKNLLMYAVMRFGKSFTSMCCATEMGAKVVLIVTAKADVKEEWKKTVESHIRFKDYEFFDSKDLLISDTIITTKLETKNLVLFLTLQDLQGEEIKSKHKEVFENQIDLLIIDETHFGARAIEYGKVLEDAKLTKSQIISERKNSDETLDNLEQTTKVLNAKVRLHLSGTPYRILMGSEFTEKDIIAFYQFSDIANDQEDWDKENINKDDIKEWENPYYGFPQMIRFAFNPNESSRKKMEELKKHGVTYAFSSLLKPKSITKDTLNQNHKLFEHENEILDLLEVIDGSKKDENLLGFLDYNKIKEGKMCRHLVCVLPYRASCDALENLINTQKDKFKNLNDYEIINIAGVENEKIYKDIKSVKSKIKECESQNKKTLTLTVNRMLTGSTVEEWDTMLYLKDTASPQEYDQAIFRLQNQYIREFKEPNGDKVKYNMKPQTLLVDFNPNRMFSMQEQKSQIYNVNTDKNGNSILEDRIKRELEISPIIVLNNNKIVEVKPSDVIDAVRKYSSERSVLDEAIQIPVDFSLINDIKIKSEIEKQGKIGSKQGLEIKPTIGDGGDIDVPSGSVENDNNSTPIGTNDSTSVSKEDEETEFKSKFAMYYAKILFFAFLTESIVKSLTDIIDQFNLEPDNIRIAASLELDKAILELLQSKMNPFILSKLDYKIQNINTLANDKTLEPIQRTSNALKKFSRLSSSEIVTPENIADDIINILPKDAIKKDTKILDIASKQGEFVYAIYKKYGKDIANNFYSIPTSKIAYEFTRKVYILLGLDTSKIIDEYTSYDLLKNNEIIKKNEINVGKNKFMKINVIVGNPPYQEIDGGGGLGASASPIYNYFVNIAKQLNPRIITIITPSRWYAGGKGLDEFRIQMLNDINIAELHDFLNPNMIFPNTNNRGGICYFLWDKLHNNKIELTKVFTYTNDLTPTLNIRDLKTEGTDILIRHMFAVNILKKVKSNEKYESFKNYVSTRKPFGLNSKFNRTNNFYKSPENLIDPIVCYAKGRTIGYVEGKSFSFNQELLNSYKVFTSFANNIGTELNDDNLNTFIGDPKSVCTETYIILGIKLNLNQSSSENLIKYFKTKFTRFFHSIAKSNQNGTAKTYKFVPLQDFTENSDIDWSKSVAEIDQQLYVKYKLDPEEIKFIESMIKPME